MDAPNLSPGKAARNAQQQARNAANSSWARGLARLGYAARGIVYILIGGLAAAVAFGAGGETTDNKGAIEAIHEQPFGKFLLGAVAIGLIGYVLWSFIRAAFDADNKGSDPKGILTRLSYAISGVIYTGLAIAALQLVLGTGSTGQNSDATAQDWTARLLNLPFGVALVILGGLLMLGVGGYQFYQAYKAKFKEEFDLSEMDAKWQKGVERLGRFGHAARGVVFGLIGLFLIIAAIRHNPDEAKGLGGALQELTRQPFGPFLLGVVALGLVAFGLYSLALARFRRLGTA